MGDKKVFVVNKEPTNGGNDCPERGQKVDKDCDEQGKTFAKGWIDLGNGDCRKQTCEEKHPGEDMILVNGCCVKKTCDQRFPGRGLVPDDMGGCRKKTCEEKGYKDHIEGVNGQCRPRNCDELGYPSDWIKDAYGNCVPKKKPCCLEQEYDKSKIFYRQDGTCRLKTCAEQNKPGWLPQPDGSCKRPVQ